MIMFFQGVIKYSEKQFNSLYIAPDKDIYISGLSMKLKKLKVSFHFSYIYMQYSIKSVFVKSSSPKCM